MSDLLESLDNVMEQRPKLTPTPAWASALLMILSGILFLVTIACVQLAILAILEHRSNDKLHQLVEEVRLLRQSHTR